MLRGAENARTERGAEIGLSIKRSLLAVERSSEAIKDCYTCGERRYSSTLTHALDSPRRGEERLLFIGTVCGQVKELSSSQVLFIGYANIKLTRFDHLSVSR